MEDPTKMVACKDRFYWDQGTMMLGNIYMTLHSLMLTFSAVGLILNFYLLPKKEGLLISFDLFDRSEKDFFDDEVTKLLLESCLEKKEEEDAEDLDKEDSGTTVNAINDEEFNKEKLLDQ